MPDAPAPGCLFVIAAPSGGGKTSLVNALLAREPGIRLSVSYTTRAPRPGEHEGVHYHFVDDARFTALRDAGEFLEHAHVHGHWYATSATWLAAQVAAGQDVLLEIDWQGAVQVRRLMPDSVHIFILPPSLGVLQERLERRGQDAPEVIARRLAGAGDEMRHWQEFDCGRRDAALARVRLCYYQSRLCDCHRRPGRDCSRGPAQGGAPARPARPIVAGADRTRFLLNPTRTAMARITIEDALEKIPNRFELTLAATNRARQITSGSSPLVETDRDKPTVIALREIAAGKVGIEMLLKPAT